MLRATAGKCIWRRLNISSARSTAMWHRLQVFLYTVRTTQRLICTALGVVSAATDTGTLMEMLKTTTLVERPSLKAGLREWGIFRERYIV